MHTKNFEKNYDVFHSFLVRDAEYSGYIELPKIKTSEKMPSELITFSKAMLRSCKIGRASCRERV